LRSVLAFPKPSQMKRQPKPAEETGWPLVEDGRLLAPYPDTVWTHDGQGDEIDYPGYDHEDAAQAYVDDAEWGEPHETKWIPVHTYRVGIRDDGEMARYDEQRHANGVPVGERE
jgi:hypothetical protein